MTTTPGGVILPDGWNLHQEDTFGTNPSQTVKTFIDLHAKYCEWLFIDQGACLASGLDPGYGQELIRHFEEVMTFAPDHITINASDQPNGDIWSGQMVSNYSADRFAIEALLQTSPVPGAWPAFWQFGLFNTVGDSEIDFEFPITINDTSQTVNDVSCWMHGPEVAAFEYQDPNFDPSQMNYRDLTTDFSAATHYYTTIYDGTRVSKYVDGRKIYTTLWTAGWRRPYTVLDLGVGGGWTGIVTPPFSADFRIDAVRYYGP